MAWYEELLRSSTSAETAVRLFEARGSLDVRRLAPEVRARTLVIHARDDRVVPVEEGRLLAALIPGARLVLLESANHILLADEPAWQALRLRAPCVPRHRARCRVRLRRPPTSAHGSWRCSSWLLRGLTNEAIAERLYVSVRTVERHLSNVYAKLGVSGKAARAAAAARFSQLSEPPSLRR